MKVQDNIYYRCNQKATGRVLDALPDGKAYILPWNGGDYQRWSPVIAADKWHVTQDEIVYDRTQPPTDTHPVDIISKQVWKNDSPAKISETIKHSITKTSTFQWGLKETLKTGIKCEFSANIPFIASAKTEVSVEMGLEAHQTWSNTVSETYEVLRQVTLDQRSAIEVHAYIDWADDFKTPFTLKMWVSATADARSGPDYPLSSEQLESLLKEAGFSGKIIDNSVPNKLLVSISGEFSGSYGMTTHVDIHEIPLSQAPDDAITV